MKALLKVLGSLLALGGFFIFFGVGDVGIGLLVVLLGLFILIVAFREKSKKCPFCATRIPLEANVCPNCQRDLAGAK